jgi:hypothetical protein
VDFYRLTTFYRQFPKRASTSRTSGLRLGRVGIIGWPLQKLLLLSTGQSSKTCFYNMLGKEDQSRKGALSGRFPIRVTVYLFPSILPFGLKVDILFSIPQQMAYLLIWAGRCEDGCGKA